MKRTVHRAVVDAGIRGERRTNAAPSLARIRSSCRNAYYHQDTVPRALPGASGTPSWLPTAGAVYAFRSLTTGARYFGSTGNLRRRWAIHRALLRGGNHYNHALQAHFKEHGEEDLVVDVVLFEEDKATRLKIEQAFLGIFYGTDGCFNAAPSVVSATHLRGHSDETRAKIAEGLRGLVRSPETRARVAAAGRGRKASPETRVRTRGGSPPPGPTRGGRSPWPR